MLPLTFDHMMPSISFQEKYFRKTNDFPVLKNSFKIQGISLDEGEDENTDTHRKTHTGHLLRLSGGHIMTWFPIKWKKIISWKLIESIESF